MKTLTIEQMEAIHGGFNNFWRGACAVWATLSYFKVFAYATPASAALAMAADITCIVVGLQAAGEMIGNALENN